MGATGPIPLRSEERRRTNSPEVTSTSPEDLASLPFEVDLSPEPPPADEISEKWHPLAQQLWDAMLRSPERAWVTSAGWALFRIEVENLSRELKPQVVGVTEGGWRTDPDDPDTKVWEPGGAVIEVVPIKGANLAAHHKIWAAMGLLEGDRRRMQREVTLHTASATGPLPEGVTDIRKNRADLLTPRTPEA